jgi:putative solute:sodium symporter small subunit
LREKSAIGGQGCLIQFLYLSQMNTTNHKKYWRTNLKYLAILLAIWFLVSYGFGILLVDELNTIRLGGFKLGFWFAQQGSIYVFVILIFVYVQLMNKLDKKYKLDD